MEWSWWQNFTVQLFWKLSCYLHISVLDVPVLYSYFESWVVSFTFQCLTCLYCTVILKAELLPSYFSVGRACTVQSLLELWQYNGTLIRRLTLQQIINTVNTKLKYRYKIITHFIYDFFCFFAFTPVYTVIWVTTMKDSNLLFRAYILSKVLHVPLITWYG